MSQKHSQFAQPDSKPKQPRHQPSSNPKPAPQSSSKLAPGSSKPKPHASKCHHHTCAKSQTEVVGSKSQMLPYQQISESQVLQILAKFGEYPEKHRFQIWKTLLALPGDSGYFNKYCAKEEHPAVELIRMRFPIKDDKLMRNFSTVMSALAHWCALMAENDFIPAVVFPFVKLAGDDLIGAFEMSMSFIYNWMWSWFENYPNAPVKYLIAAEDIIKSEEPRLVEHLASLSLTPSTYLWPIIKYIFTQVMTKEEVSILLDHLLSNYTKPQLLLTLSSAYIIYYKSTLLSLKNAKEIQGFFVQQNPINMTKLLQLAKSLLAKAPEYECRVPLIEYPSFTNYPEFALSLQVSVREKLVHQDLEMRLKQRYIQDINKKFSILEAEEYRLRREQEALIQAENDKRRLVALEENLRLQEQQKLDQETRKVRLSQIQRLEDIIEKSLKSAEVLKKKELKSIEEEMQARTKADNYYVSAKAEEENLSLLEFKAAQRLLELTRIKTSEECMRKLKIHSLNWDREQEQREKILKRQYEIENEQRRIDIEMIKESKLKELELCKEYNSKRRMDVQQHLKTLERDLKMLDLEKEQKLRVLAEEELLRNEEYLAQLKIKQELAREQDERHFELMLQQEKEFKRSKNEELLRQIRAEQLQQAETLRRQREENETLEKNLEEQAVRDKIAQMRAESEFLAQEKEKMMQETLINVERERETQRRVNEELNLRKRELQERNNYQRLVRDNVDEAIQREREDFFRFREEVKRENEKIDIERQRAYDRKMNEIVRQREETLMQLSVPIRKAEEEFKEKVNAFHEEAQEKRNTELLKSEYSPYDEEHLAQYRGLEENSPKHDRFTTKSENYERSSANYEFNSGNNEKNLGRIAPASQKYSGSSERASWKSPNTENLGVQSEKVSWKSGNTEKASGNSKKSEDERDYRLIWNAKSEENRGNFEIKEQLEDSMSSSGLPAVHFEKKLDDKTKKQPEIHEAPVTFETANRARGFDFSKALPEIPQATSKKPKASSPDKYSSDYSENYSENSPSSNQSPPKYEFPKFSDLKPSEKRPSDLFDINKISKFTKDIRENPHAKPGNEKLVKIYEECSSSSEHNSEHSERIGNLLSRKRWEDDSYEKCSSNSIESSELSYHRLEVPKDSKFFISKTQNADIEYSDRSESYSSYESHDCSSCIYSSSECSCDYSSKESTPALVSPANYHYSGSDYSEDSYVRHSHNL